MSKKNMKASWNVKVVCEDIQNMSSNLEHVSFVYISKTFNSVAHNLISSVLNFISTWCFLKSTFPSWVVNEAKIPLDISCP